MCPGTPTIVARGGTRGDASTRSATGLDHPRRLPRDDNLDPLVSLIEQRLAVRYERDTTLELGQRLLQSHLASLQRADDLLQLAESFFERDGSGIGHAAPKTRMNL